jgi:hypothetical protein
LVKKNCDLLLKKSNIENFLLEPNQKYIFSLIALNENNDTAIPEQFYDFQMPSEGKLNYISSW